MMKKIGLIVAGLLFSLIVIECFLQITSFIYNVKINHRIENSLKNKKNITLLCIGESTTEGQWPINLQELLDKKYPNKFSVIDCGVVGINTVGILSQLKKNIKKYKPDIIVSMIGINDWKILPWDKSSHNFFYKLFYKFKTYKVFCYFINYFESLKKYEKKELFILQDMFSQYFENKTYEDEKDVSFISNILIYDKKLKELYDSCSNKNLKYKLFKNLSNDNDYALWYSFLISTETVNNDKIIYNAEIFDIANNSVLDNINEKDYNDIFYGHIAIEFLKQNNIEKAKEYFQKAEQYRLKYYNFNTQKTYEEIINIAFENGIKFIAMQYPIRSVVSLKSLLRNSIYYDNIIFVSNENAFKNYLYNGGNYKDLFIDQFAGDFGHQTNLGNKLISKNVEKALRKIFK